MVSYAPFVHCEDDKPVVTVGIGDDRRQVLGQPCVPVVHLFLNRCAGVHVVNYVWSDKRELSPTRIRPDIRYPGLTRNPHKEGEWIVALIIQPIVSAHLRTGVGQVLHVALAYHPPCIHFFPKVGGGKRPIVASVIGDALGVARKDCQVIGQAGVGDSKTLGVKDALRDKLFVDVRGVYGVTYYRLIAHVFEQHEENVIVWPCTRGEDR